MRKKQLFCVDFFVPTIEVRNKNNCSRVKYSSSWIKYPRYAHIEVKFIYSEKAKKFCEISTVDLSYVVTVKSTMEILQNFVAFSEYMNFNNFPYHTQ